MSLSALINRPCVIVRRSDSTVDDYGDPTTTETSEDTVCELQLYTRRGVDSGEVELDQAPTEVGLIFLPGSIVPPGGLDAVTIPDIGATYEFNGPSEAVRNPRTGLTSHIQGEVRRVQ